MSTSTIFQLSINSFLIRFIFQKLEQTVAGNARLEQELAVLRQKLQGQHMGHNGKGDTLNDGTDARSAVDATAMLEDGKFKGDYGFLLLGRDFMHCS